MALTPRQKHVLDFISGFVDEHGYCPSYEEIAAGLQLASLATVHKHISALEGKNYLRRAYNQSRSLELAQRYYDEMPAARQGGVELAVPVEGRIAAGAPVEQYEAGEKLTFRDFAGDRDSFALEVRGDSMIEDHICDGDYVLIERTADARNGDIVVALVDGSETTLKRYYREGDTVRLQPANSAMEPIRVPAAGVAVQGRLLAVMRKYR
ncbi:MAG: transcriptional repressor LexA [Bryobacteraceae bacterium]